MAFAIVSSLVICSMLGYTLTAIALDGRFPWEESPAEQATDEANFEDPNEDAIGAQQTEVARNPESIEEMLLLANLLGNSGRLPEAIPWYERVLAQAPDDLTARLDFARALSDGGLKADAELQFQRVIATDPRSQDGHFYLAELYRTSAPPRLADAAREYGEAKAIDPLTFVGQRANEALLQMGVGQPVGSPSPVTSPEVDNAP